MDLADQTRSGRSLHKSWACPIRDGVPPIELVDGEKLILMLEQLELGLKPRTIYEIDAGFFDSFH